MSDSAPFGISILGSTLTGSVTLTLTAAATGAQPWTFGHPFARGDLFPADLGLISGATAFQADVRNLWDDGSVKYAVLSGVSNFAGAPVAVRIGKGGVTSSGGTVQEPTADWYAANVVADIIVEGAGAYSPGPARTAGIIPWNRLLPHKRRQFLGPVMSEFHYYVPTTNAHLTLWFYVRCYSTGQVEVHVVAENGWLNMAGSSHRSYGMAVTLGGTKGVDYKAVGVRLGTTWERTSDTVLTKFGNDSVYKDHPAGSRFVFNEDDPVAYTVTLSEGGRYVNDLGKTVLFSRLHVEGQVLPVYTGTKSIVREGHTHHTRWDFIGWVGTDPGVRPQHDPIYLGNTKMVPMYWRADGNPSTTKLNSLLKSVIPFARNSWPLSMGASGSNAKLLEEWDSFYLRYPQDPLGRTWDSMIAHARTSGRYSIHFRDETTGEPPIYTAYPTHGVTDGFGSTNLATGSIRFPTGGWPAEAYTRSHQPNLGYLAYLMTGRWPFRETCEFQAQTNWWQVNTSRFEGARIMPGNTNNWTLRMSGWGMRSVGYCIATMPDSEPRRAQYIDQFVKTIRWADQTYRHTNPIGFIQTMNGYDGLRDTDELDPARFGPGTARYASFQQHYYSIPLAWAYEAIAHLFGADRAQCETFIRWRMNHVVMLNGGLDGGYCWRHAAHYNPVYGRPRINADGGGTYEDFVAGVFKTGADVFFHTLTWEGAEYWKPFVTKPNGDPDPEKQSIYLGYSIAQCGEANTILGESGASAGVLTSDGTSYWAINNAMLSYACNLEIPGALALWDRLWAADNWRPAGTSLSTGFRNKPSWAMIPRVRA